MFPNLVIFLSVLFTFLLFYFVTCFVILVIDMLIKHNHPNLLDNSRQIDLSKKNLAFIISIGIGISILYAFFEQFPKAEILRSAVCGILIAQFILIISFGKDIYIANYIFERLIRKHFENLKEDAEREMKEKGII